MQISGKEGRESFELSRNSWTLELPEQICWTSPFTCSLHIPVSRVSLCGLLLLCLAKILGSDPREWSWLLQVGCGPWRGAGGVRELTNYSSLQYGGEGCPQHSFGALTGHLSKHLLTWARWTAMGVLCLNLLLLHFAAEISGSKADLLQSLSAFSAMISLWLQTSVTWPICFNTDNFYYLSEKSGCALMLYLLHTHFQALGMP